jgi:hypothetical protein
MAKKPNRNYFTQETEDAIILYNKTTDPQVKSRIYGDLIHYGFFKLTQNIIHTFKFYHTEVDNLEHLQQEIHIFLLEKIHLYNHRQSIQDRLNKIIIKEFKEEYTGDFREYVGDVDKVTQQQINSFIKDLNVSDECMEKLKKLTPPKAYSYFGTIVKRWCIVYNNKNYNKKISKIPMDGLDQDEKFSYDLEFNPYKDKLQIFLEEYISYMDENLSTIFPKSKDLEIADAILQIFKTRSNIEVLEKKVIYFYIREILPDIKTPRITKIADVMKNIFKEKYIFYIENDYIKM